MSSHKQVVDLSSLTPVDIFTPAGTQVADQRLCVAGLRVFPVRPLDWTYLASSQLIVDLCAGLLTKHLEIPNKGSQITPKESHYCKPIQPEVLWKMRNLCMCAF